MTNTTAVLLPIAQRRVRSAIMNALGRSGVSTATAEAIWHDLTTGNDPRPANLPESFHYRGLRVDWPGGRHLRTLAAHEIHSLNAALKAMGVRGSELLDDEDNAETARGAFTALYSHKTTASAQYGAYDPEPVRAAKLRELVAEATTPEPILVHEGQSTHPSHDGLPAVPEPEGCPFERVECLDMQDSGEGACDEHEPPTRDELIAAKQATATVQIVTTPERVVTAQAVPLEPTSDLDSLLADINALQARLEGLA